MLFGPHLLSLYVVWSFVFHRIAEVIQVWNEMRVYHNKIKILVEVVYPFNYSDHNYFYCTVFTSVLWSL